MSVNQELVMETTHGRSKKCKTEFKAVLNKVLVSGLVLATMLGTAIPAFAAEMSLKDAVNGGYNNNIAQEYGVSVESAISNIKNTIKAIENMKANGIVSDSQIKELASQLYSLESAVLADEGVTSDVVSVLNSAENAIKGLSNASKAEVALAVVRSNLGIDSVTVSNKSAAVTVSSFSDVPQGHWAYDAIMKMVNKGLFSGTTTPVNGVGMFAPDKTMTRAEFVVVVVRALYKSELDAMPAVAEGEAWWSNAYQVAVEHGLLLESELEGGNLSSPMNRQEMSMVLSRACEAMGESKGQQVKSAAIPDYNSIGTYYRDYVIQSYSKGMLAGTDNNGTFNPMGTLNRAQAATVLYRLVEPSSRQEVDFNKVTTPEVNQGEVQKWVEGETHSEPKVGDIVIKDGKEIVLKTTKVGDCDILAYGQGVDCITGTTINGNVRTANNLGSAWSGFNNTDLTPFIKDPITGEVHTEYEWGMIRLTTQPKNPGSYNGEIQNTYFEWDSSDNYWYWTGPSYGK